MSKTGIDVSSFQGTIDWAKVKQSGVDFAILKIIMKKLTPDKQFENNWSGCAANGIPVEGVYNYSYATTPEKARTDAQAVIRILNGRKTRVWLDVEDKCQQGLGRKLIEIIEAYRQVIESAGLSFGVYTGQSFYLSFIKPYTTPNYPLWIARYGNNDGKLNTKYQPVIDGMVGWQYSSRGSVSGIVGNVDMNVWYEEIDKDMEVLPFDGNPYPEPVRVLYQKTIPMIGDDVKWLQYELIRHECLTARNSKGKTNIDGILGTATSTAIKLFQKQAGITADGKCGVVTVRYLKM